MVLPLRPTNVGRVLRAAESAPPVEAVTAVARELGGAFGAVAVSFLITDASGRGLARLAHVPLSSGPVAIPGPSTVGERRDGEESAGQLPFDGGPEEQALRTQTVTVLAPDAATTGGTHREWWRVLAPVTERGEAIGLLELYLSAEPDDVVTSEIGELAHLLAFVVIANRRHTDLYEWGQRSQAFTLSAEIQQRLLPEARTCEATAFTLAGWLEPASRIGGDTFDYSVDRDVLHLSLTDAMGHGVNAALTASVGLGSLRGARRRGASLPEQARSTNAALFEHSVSGTGVEFVAGLVGRVDLPTGALEIVNAGHVPPYLLRGGRLTTLPLHVNLPFGMFEGTTYQSTAMHLEPGDRLVLVTDGMLERNAAGSGLLAGIEATRDLHPREVVRALADLVLEATGRALQDDATVLCLDWHGAHGGPRDTVAGADPARASEPLT